MPQFAYAFDPHASNDENIIRNEEHALYLATPKLAWFHPKNETFLTWPTISYFQHPWESSEITGKYIAPSGKHSTEAAFGIVKKIHVNTSALTIKYKADEKVIIYVNGMRVTSLGGGTYYTANAVVVPNTDVTIAIAVHSVAGYTGIEFDIFDSNNVIIAKSDETWRYQYVAKNCATVDVVESNYLPETFVDNPNYKQGGYRVIIPNFAPFFEDTEIEVMCNGQPLLMGVDYYLSHKYFTGTVRTGKLMYSGIWIINPKLFGTVTVKYRTLGGKFTVNRSVINDYLTNRISDPSTASWEEVINDDPYFPYVDLQFDRERFANESELISSVREIAEVVRTKDQTTNDMYELLDDWFLQLKSIVDNSTLLAHQDDTSNPHDERWYESEALHEHGISKDAAKVFGRTISELTSYINSQGITQADLDNYVKRTDGNTLTGDIVLKDGLVSFEYMYQNIPSVRLNLSNGNISFDTLSDVIIQADKDKNKPGKKAILKSGMVELSVTSSGAAQDLDGLRINDKIILHDGNLDSHIPDMGTNVLDLETKDTESLSFSGKGVADDPLSANVTLNDATTTAHGVAVGTVDRTKDQPNKVALSQGSAALDAVIKAKVPDTIKINGQRLDKDLTLTKDNFGLSNVEDVADVDMPVSQGNVDALANKAPDDHVHTFEEMGLPRATGTKFGVTYLEDDPLSTVTDRGFSSEKLNILNSDVNRLKDKAESSLPIDAMDITQYGGNGYLPLPVQGSYGSAGRDSEDFTGGLMLEENGMLVFLRNGSDGDVKRTYYATAKIASNDSILNINSTSTPYEPNILPHGHYVKSVIRNTDSAMLALAVDDEGNEYLVYIDIQGTFDPSRHKGCRVISDIRIDNSELCRHWPFIYNETCYIVGLCNYDSEGYLYMVLYSAPLSEIRSNTEVVFEKHTLTGKDLYGNDESGKKLRLVKKNFSWRIEDEPLFFNNLPDSGGINSIHTGRIYTYMYHENGVVKFGFGGNGIVNDPYGQLRPDWTVGVTVDVNALTVIPDDKCRPPLVINPDRTVSGEIHRSISKMAPPGNRGTEGGLYYTRGKCFTISVKVSLPVTVRAVKNTSEYAGIEGESIDKRDYVQVGGFKDLVGNFGSESKAFFYAIGCDANNNFYMRQRLGIRRLRCKYDPNGNYGSVYPHEFGPTSERVWVSEQDAMLARQQAIHIDETGGMNNGVVLTSDSLTAFYDLNDKATEVAVSDALAKDTLAKIVTLSNMPEDVGKSNITFLINKPSDVPSIAVVQTIKDVNDGTNKHKAYVSVVEVTPNVTIGNITSFSLGRVLNYRHVSSNGWRYKRFDDAVNSSSVIKVGNEYTILMNSLPALFYLGWMDIYAFTIKYNPATDTWSNFESAKYDTYIESEGLLGVPQIGIVRIYNDRSSTRLFGKVHLSANPNYKVGEEVLLHSSKVATGWWIYFTQKTQFFINNTLFEIPPVSFDLRNWFPNTHQNNTFYLYASVEGGSPHYVIKEQLVADSASEIFIGHCRTGATQIDELVVNRATRLGNFREFEEHVNEPKPHGLDLSQVTPVDVGLGLLENKDIRHTLKIPTFKEVFDSWYRLSHRGEKPYPAIPAETNTWTYAEATDEIRNTTNSSSFVGMVSPVGVEVGDYDFITGLSSTSRDDDWVGVIFALVEKDGVQHTLSALCSGTDSRTVHFAVYYNWAQGAGRGQKTLYSHTTTLKHGWDEIPERILTVKRRGDVFDLHVTKMMTDAASEQTFSFDVKDHPELATLFRGAVRFGYCAQSQPYSTWRNILRPDEDGKNYYASQKLYRDNFSWSKRMPTVTGNVILQTNVGEEYVAYIPIPEEYQHLPLHGWGSIKKAIDGYGGVLDPSLIFTKEATRIKVTSPIGGRTKPGFYTPIISYVLNFYTDPRMI